MQLSVKPPLSVQQLSAKPPLAVKQPLAVKPPPASHVRFASHLPRHLPGILCAVIRLVADHDLDHASL